MIEYLGPFLIVLGPICFTLCAHLDTLFSSTEHTLDDIENLEKEHITSSLKRIFSSSDEESFTDPNWITTFQRHYHANVKDLKEAELNLRNLHETKRHAKTGLILLGISFILLGATYTASVNLKIFEDSRDVVLVADVVLIIILVLFSFFCVSCIRKYKKYERQTNEIVKSQKLLLRGLFFYGQEANEDDQ